MESVNHVQSLEITTLAWVLNYTHFTIKSKNVLVGPPFCSLLCSVTTTGLQHTKVWIYGTLKSSFNIKHMYGTVGQQATVDSMIQDCSFSFFYSKERGVN